MSERGVIAEDKRRVAALAAEIAALAPPELTPSLTIMEVCGTHTMSIARSGLRQLLPPSLRLISGPGCPVCVTDASLVGAALALALEPGIILTSFGDMLRVPAGSRSLLSCRDQGAEVRVVLSPLEALDIAVQQPRKQVVFLAVGFETTAPLIASTLELARERQVANFTVLAGNKTMPNALRALLGADSRVNALLCPGHVAAVMGSSLFEFIPAELGLPAAIAGFAPAEILLAIRELVRMARAGRPSLVNAYPQVVRKEGNPAARAALERVFIPSDAVWRGLGPIADSGLALDPEFAPFDAALRFADVLDAAPPCADHPACSCGAVLRGQLEPAQCPLFGNACRPERPIGACMVSGEGSCAAAYKYQAV